MESSGFGRLVNIAKMFDLELQLGVKFILNIPESAFLRFLPKILFFLLTNKLKRLLCSILSLNFMKIKITFTELY